MVNCYSCGKNIGVYEGSVQGTEGKTYCIDCSKRTLVNDIQYQKGKRSLCNFQEPIFQDKSFLGFNCLLSLSFSSSVESVNNDISAENKMCNTDKCPMFQTWQLLKKDP